MSVDVDTIAAVATAPGNGALAVVRISGPDAHGILRALKVELPPPRRPALVYLVHPGDGSALDRAVVTRFDAPASFTGEDAVEISCHGGFLVPALVLDACLAAGARQAEPGEFTRRAYLRGKLDLVQAEAVADLIGARSLALHKAALGQLERGLSERVGALRQEVLRMEAMLAHHLDFPEEDDAPVPLEEVVRAADAVTHRLGILLATAPEGELLREGATVVLAGRPNAGKSSLYNALIGEERAIVTEVPGTTRDALEVTVQIGGYPFRLVDTAGLRDTEDRVERVGVEVARRYLGRADVVLLCVEAGEAPGCDVQGFLDGLGDVPIVLVRTKCDLRAGAGAADGPDERWAGRVRTSVKDGTGLAELRGLLPSLVYSGLVELAVDAPVLTRRRHAVALGAAWDSILEFRSAVTEGVPPELASTHLRAAESSLEEVIGVVSTEDVLDVLFAEFCIGK